MRTLAERLWAKVDRSTGPDGCWIFTGATNKGYGWIGVGGTDAGSVLAHRAAYEILVGPIPAGLELDHLCHNRDPNCPGGLTCPHRRCVNPNHLEPVTGLENLRREAASRKTPTHCRAGLHFWTPENTARRGRRRQRVCRACERIAYAVRNAGPRPPTAIQLARAARRERYAGLRRAGMTQLAAATEVGVTQACGSKWECEGVVTVSSNLRTEVTTNGLRT